MSVKEKNMICELFRYVIMSFKNCDKFQTSKLNLQKRTSGNQQIEKGKSESDMNLFQQKPKEEGKGKQQSL